MTEALRKLISIKDFELAARNNLSKTVYDYYAGGACDEITVSANESAYSKLCIKYHVLNDVSNRSSCTKLFGQKLSSPIIIGPTAFHALANSDGELATAAAAKEKDCVFTLSTLANFSIEEVASIGGSLWYQLYVGRDKDLNRRLVQKVEELGCKALVVTVDAQVTGRRERDIRNQFTLPLEMRIPNLNIIRNKRNSDDDLLSDNSPAANLINSIHDHSFSWNDIEWLRSITNLPIILKGIIRGDDAQRSESCGVNGIVVSNHGGRSIDTAPSTLSVLPEIAAAVTDKIDIILDGGIRRGTDVFKALALGAKAVMIGRPILWGLAVGGREGVARILQILLEEFDLSMALAGCTSTSEISSDLIGVMR